MGAKTLFNVPYAGIDKGNDLDLLIGLNGEVSVVLEIINPVVRFSAFPAGYDEFHHLLTGIIKVLGDGYILQKQDVISRTPFEPQPANEYLQQKYNQHFAGRDRLAVSTYLTITRQIRKGTFYVYDARVLSEFRQAVAKVMELLPGSRDLKEAELDHLVLQFLSMTFGDATTPLNNLAPTDTEIRMGERSVRSISLVNIDRIDLPPSISTHIELNDKDSIRGFPVDLLSFLFRVPGCDAVVYNQLVEIPNQTMTLRKLEQKKKRHAGIPDPANQLCVEDIDLLLNDVARENQLLVNCHFNILVCARHEVLPKACNFIDSALFQLGIIPSRNAYNQLELFRSALPGNGGELKIYDWFLTTADAALCFFFKESLPKDEPSDFLLRFTDRQGIPVGMDPADLPMRTGRINNRNKFVLGPSGSGKSFFMNALIEQYMLYNMDMVIVDTGHSYSGLCAYYQGKYITYSDQSPITMNPFQLTEGEYNIEKKDFLTTLIGLLWKGSDGSLSQVERDVISNVISSYYSQYFSQRPFPGLTREKRWEVHRRVFRSMGEDQDSKHLHEPGTDNFPSELVWPELRDADEVLIDALELPASQNGNTFFSVFRFKYLQALREEEHAEQERFEKDHIRRLDFNSFYDFALQRMPDIRKNEGIQFDLDEFRYVLKKFYRGGEFEPILNQQADHSLFTERFIVFEIDSIKGAHVMAA
ncbi:DUF87 domain-containing protein [Mucilaginibacter sp. PAMB04274]|uniref:TraG/VirB4 family ATPase n=1 Tax=Mucilaginibacter sp. PAMB04274 TaxID=3138568 RepID=UPI0031F6DE8A